MFIFFSKLIVEKHTGKGPVLGFENEEDHVKSKKRKKLGQKKYCDGCRGSYLEGTAIVCGVFFIICIFLFITAQRNNRTSTMVG